LLTKRNEEIRRTRQKQRKLLSKMPEKPQKKERSKAKKNPSMLKTTNEKEANVFWKGFT